MTAMLLLVAIAAAGSSEVPKALQRQAVFAEWDENAWFHGKIIDACKTGYRVRFDDGNVKCCTPEQLVIDRISDPKEVGKAAKVLAPWKDKRFYPGTVVRQHGERFDIAFKDGDHRTVPVEDIRLRLPLPRDDA